MPGRALLVLLVVCVAACDETPRPYRDRVDAAKQFTRSYAASPLAKWNVRAAAAGDDCNVLFIRTSMILGDTLVEALHYGAGPYEIVTGGVQHFSRQRRFRGIAYIDGSGRIWTFDDVTPAEVETIKPCE